jgi:hypothetical protein
MAITAAQVTVAATATSIAAAGASGARVTVAVPSGGATVTLGPAAVTSGAGYLLAAGQSVTLDLPPLDTLYGIVASSTQAVSVFVVRR